MPHSGEFINNSSITGSIDDYLLSISGSIVPASIDLTHVHYDTKANWDRQTFLIAERGHLYIYKDAETTYIDGKKVEYPGIKIGDGSSYLIDMPYAAYGSDHEKIIDHIHDYAIHVGRVDRVNWNEKVTATVVEENEELIFRK